MSKKKDSGNPKAKKPQKKSKKEDQKKDSDNNDKVEKKISSNKKNQDSKESSVKKSGESEQKFAIQTSHIIAIASGVIALLAGLYMVLRDDPKVATQPVPSNPGYTITIEAPEEPEPTTMQRGLDGAEVAIADAFNTPTCVMIENLAGEGVRPQSGLSNASLVYEVIVEGGITRFMAVFPGEEGSTETKVGPIRSARDTYLEFASELDCAYTHAGGSFTAMQAIPQFELKDIDALREANFFYRDSGKRSPHNLFSTTADLNLAVTQGHSWTEDTEFDTWNFVDEIGETDEGDEDEDSEPLEPANAASEIDILYGFSYNAEYRYNETNNTYERYHAGIAHTDANSGNTIEVKNVVVQHVPQGWYIEGKGRINFDVNGEGDAEVYRNGQAVAATWKKPSRTERTQYYYRGTDIPMDFLTGNTWISIVPEGIGVESR